MTDAPTPDIQRPEGRECEEEDAEECNRLWGGLQVALSRRWKRLEEKTNQLEVLEKRYREQQQELEHQQSQMGLLCELVAKMAGPNGLWHPSEPLSVLERQRLCVNWLLASPTGQRPSQCRGTQVDMTDLGGSCKTAVCPPSVVTPASMTPTACPAPYTCAPAHDPAACQKSDQPGGQHADLVAVADKIKQEFHRLTALSNALTARAEVLERVSNFFRGHPEVQHLYNTWAAKQVNWVCNEDHAGVDPGKEARSGPMTRDEAKPAVLAVGEPQGRVPVQLGHPASSHPAALSPQRPKSDYPALNIVPAGGQDHFVELELRGSGQEFGQTAATSSAAPFAGSMCSAGMLLQPSVGTLPTQCPIMVPVIAPGSGALRTPNQPPPSSAQGELFVQLSALLAGMPVVPQSQAPVPGSRCIQAPLVSSAPPHSQADTRICTSPMDGQVILPPVVADTDRGNPATPQVSSLQGASHSVSLGRVAGLGVRRGSTQTPVALHQSITSREVRQDKGLVMQEAGRGGDSSAAVKCTRWLANLWPAWQRVDLLQGRYPPTTLTCPSLLWLLRQQSLVQCWPCSHGLPLIHLYLTRLFITRRSFWGPRHFVVCRM